MTNLVDITGKPIDEAPHIADCAEMLRMVAERIDGDGEPEGRDLATAEHALVLILLADGSKFEAFDRGQTIATTLFMLECAKAALIDRAREKG